MITSFLQKMFLLVVGIILIIPQGSSAQYFGRNKVQYEDFKYKVLRTSHYDIYHYPSEHERVKDAAWMLERWYTRYARLLDYSIDPYQPIILYANHADFQQTNVIRGLISQGTGGVTEGMRNRVVIPFTGVNREDNHVLGHELVHAFQYDILKSSGQRLQAAQQMPLWFVEGMAEYLSVGRNDPLTAMWMRDAVLNDDVPTIKQVSRSRKYFPYRYGHAIWAYITGNYGDGIVKPLLHGVLNDGWQYAAEEVIGLPSDSISDRWQQTIRETYEPQIRGRTAPGSVGKKLIWGEGGTNLAPAISPNGEYVAYISSRNLFSLDLYLADAHTGEVVKKLATSNTDAHFDALRFMDSAGAWSPDGQKFAFVVFAKGDNEIALLDVKTRKILRTIKLKDVSAITDIAWSPEGDRVVVSGTEGGISNLYLYNLETDSYDRLTNDDYAEFQPAWSPDGETLAFATDRGSRTDLDQYQFRSIQIGLMDLKSGQVELISMGPHVKHINPQYGPGASNLYMVADPDGYSDLYRYDLEKEQFYRLTNIATGVTGLTELSPCFTVARETGRVLMTVFDETNYHISALSSDSTKGTEFTAEESEYYATVALPPVTESSKVQRLISGNTTWLPDTLDTSTRDYKPALQLLNVGQGGIGLSANRYGTAVGGGVSFLFGDMLGNHMLSVAAQISGRIRSFGGQAIYQNLDSRYNWGIGAAHIPYLTTRTFSAFVDTTIEGQSLQMREIVQLRRWVFDDRISLMADYPFSTNRRLEFTGGYTRISYDREAESLLTYRGRTVDRQTRDLSDPDPINLFHGSVAYVGDYSQFGFTSPVSGRRFRFELEPTVGSYRYVTAIADYRKYFFWRPVTFALRGLHYGRYFQDSESQALSPLFVGYQTLVRGYEQGTFDLSECTGGGDCPEFDRLYGTRIGIVNAEFRVPLFGVEQYGLLNFPFLPTDLVGFFDGGVAWTKNESPELEWAPESSKRVPVFSTGIAARINLFGYLVGQVYYAYPFQRPNTGAHFGFVLAQGW